MTNPSSIVRFHSRKGGRASVYEANMGFQVYNNGLLYGAGVVPDSGMAVTVGGSTGAPDVAIAETPTGYKVAIDIVGTTNLTITAPSSSSRITSVVAYTNDLADDSTEPTTTGSPASCGLILVNGNTAANPVAPNDTKIRTAITSDGGTGSQAAYAVIATIKVSSTTTTITSSLITTLHSISGMMDILYPVGSFYETTDTSFDPNKAWGGTWTEDTAGRVLVAKDSGTFSTVGDTGGAETDSHTHWQSGGSDSEYIYDLTSTGVSAEGLSTRVKSGVNKLTSAELTASTGSMRQSTTYATASSTVQPYLVVKRWHRVS